MEKEGQRLHQMMWSRQGGAGSSVGGGGKLK